MKTDTLTLNKAVSNLGFWSSILVTSWTLIFVVAFGFYMGSLPTNWPGIDSFAASFKTAPYLAWVIPCLLLALTFPIVLSCIHFSTPAERKIWSWLGLMFAIMYGAILTTNYWLLATIVRESIEKGYTEGLAWFVIGSPHSITNAVEGIGYGFMGLSTFFAGFAFAGGRLERWIKRLLVINGVAGFSSVALTPVISMAIAWVSLIIWCITFPVAFVLVAAMFKKRNNPSLLTKSKY